VIEGIGKLSTGTKTQIGSFKESVQATMRLTGNRKLAEKKENPTTVAENKAVISSFLEEVLKAGLSGVDDLVAVDFVEVDPFPGQKQGREDLKQVISAFRTAFPNIHWVIEEMLREGRRYLAALPGMALTGANSLAFLERASR
jgi:hypothetical protein